jgi:hypothetical protein
VTGSAATAAPALPVTAQTPLAAQAAALADGLETLRRMEGAGSPAGVALAATQPARRGDELSPPALAVAPPHV